MIVYLIIIMEIMNVLDVISTKYALNKGYYEANPLLRKHPKLMFIYKFILVESYFIWMYFVFPLMSCILLIIGNIVFIFVVIHNWRAK